MIKFYKVGGYVRDKFLGVKSKDIDYAVEAPSYEAMRDYINAHGMIWQERPEFFTIRAQLNGENCDYVLCRKDGAYADGRHPESVEMGDIFDDLARRDFTCNAMALDENDELIDPHNGLLDLSEKRLRCVGDAYTRFSEDYLRLIRAIRFSITKHLTLDASIVACLIDFELIQNLQNIPIERIREELYRCFQYDTLATLHCLNKFRTLQSIIFNDKKLILVPTIQNHE